jgi:hypothetical protein
LTKEKAELQAKLARYESGNGAASAVVESPEATREPESPSHSARQESFDVEPRDFSPLRERFPDFDSVMSRAQAQGMRIADQAAEAMHSMEYGGHVAYLLATDDALRADLNRMPPAKQVQEIEKIGMHIEAVESGKKPFADKVLATFSRDEMSELLKGIKENKLAEDVGGELAKELFELPNGPQVFRYLVTNPDATKKIAGMSKRGAALELGRLSNELDRRYGPRIQSRAPEPIKPVSGGSTRYSVPLDQVEDQQEYKRRRQAGEKRLVS